MQNCNFLQHFQCLSGVLGNLKVSINRLLKSHLLAFSFSFVIFITPLLQLCHCKYYPDIFKLPFPQFSRGKSFVKHVRWLNQSYCGFLLLQAFLITPGCIILYIAFLLQICSSHLLTPERILPHTVCFSDKGQNSLWPYLSLL